VKASSPDGRTADLEQRIRDLETRLQRLEAEREELRHACREAREAQRAGEALLRAHDEILAATTHDLRNPLGTIVMGATALLETGGSPDPRAQRVRSVAERIHRQAERMVRQIRDLADYPDLQAGRLVLERALHAPAALVATATELVGPVARERGIAIEAHAAADLPAIECDPERVVQALTSLLAIAIKATVRGQTIETGAQSSERGVVFFVQHGAPGVDGEAAALFEPGWYSTQPGYRGAGLGFAIARGVVDAHGGAIWAVNAGADSTVYFSLPPRALI
jgi:signal transduction histidine kinase